MRLPGGILSQGHEIGHAGQDDRWEVAGKVARHHEKAQNQDIGLQHLARTFRSSRWSNKIPPWGKGIVEIWWGKAKEVREL